LLEVGNAERLCENSAHYPKLANFAKVPYSLIELRPDFRRVVQSA
jgi:hypothetical protein